MAVIGVPDSRWGEAVKALIVLKPDRGRCGGHIAFRVRETGGFQGPEIHRIRERASSQSIREDTEASAARALPGRI
ncbi:MAG: hypothetical protein ACREDL_04625 [Bradyrhizobium sp.]